MPFRIWFALACCAAAVIGIAAAADSGELRELTTDRPDVTESPFTVNPGHVQLEMSVVDFTTDRADGVRTNVWQFAPLNLRFGVTDSTELGVFVTPHVAMEERDAFGSTWRRGASDVTLRGKLNLRGNDGKGTALGLIADVKLPLAANAVRNGHTEMSVLLPVAFELAQGWEGGAMTGVDYVYTDAGRYRAAWINTITFGHELVRGIEGYVELTSATGDGPHVATFDCGLVHLLNEHTQLDAGVNVGITRNAPDLEVFLGVSRRW